MLPLPQKKKKLSDQKSHQKDREEDSEEDSEDDDSDDDDDDSDSFSYRPTIDKTINHKHWKESERKWRKRGKSKMKPTNEKECDTEWQQEKKTYYGVTQTQSKYAPKFNARIRIDGQ